MGVQGCKLSSGSKHNTGNGELLPLMTSVDIAQHDSALLCNRMSIYLWGWPRLKSKRRSLLGVPGEKGPHRSSSSGFRVNEMIRQAGWKRSGGPCGRVLFPPAGPHSKLIPVGGSRSHVSKKLLV